MADSIKIIDPLQHWIEDYLPTAEGKKPNTIASYKFAWKLFFQYMYEKGIVATEISYDMLDYDCIMGYLRWIEEVRGCTVATRNNRLAGISQFAKYSQNHDFNAAYIFGKAILKIPFKKENDSCERAYFTKEEIQIILNLPTAKDNMGVRDHVLLQIMYATGARAAEICSLRIADVRFLPDRKSSILLHGKGGKTRRIKIFEKPATALQKYIRYRGISNNPYAYIFPSQRNAMMSTKCLEEICRKYVDRAKAEYPDMFRTKSYPPHSMRHTTAMHMLEAGVPLVVIKQFLGHVNLATTEIYAKLSPEAMAEKITEWDRKYWNDYIDEEFPLDEAENSEDAADGIPGFLR